MGLTTRSPTGKGHRSVRFDLLIKGGRVIDPANNVDRVADIAIAYGRIAAVDDAIPAESAARTADATGLLVVPGLVDLHSHVYRRFTFISVDADAIGPQTGVTTGSTPARPVPSRSPVCVTTCSGRRGSESTRS